MVLSIKTRRDAVGLAAGELLIDGVWRAAADGPSFTSASGTSPFRHPVSTTHCPAAASASSGRRNTGLPFSRPSR